MKYLIDDSFVRQLIVHPTFQQAMQQNQIQNKKRTDKHFSLPPDVDQVVEEICQLLVQEHKIKMEKDCVSMYQSHIQILKEIQYLKYNVLTQSPSKTSATQFQKNKNLNSSILSDPQSQLSANPQVLRKNIEDINSKMGNSSFVHSFLGESIHFMSQSRVKQNKDELEERLNISIANLSGCLSKIQEKVEESLKGIQASLNRKIQSVYKTLTTVFQSINDLQMRLNDKMIKRQQIKNEMLEKSLLDIKLNKTISNEIQKKPDSSNTRRKSFLGFLKY